MKNPIKILPDNIRPPVEFDDIENECRHPEEAKQHVKNYLSDEVFTLNFYRIHMLYFIFMIAITSVIVYGEGLANGPGLVGGAHLTYIDALFMCTSAMTTTGLTVVNIGPLSGFQQSMLAILMILGNVTFVSFFVVVIRRHFFRRRLADMIQSSKSARQRLDDIEQHEIGQRRNNPPNDDAYGLRRRHQISKNRQLPKILLHSQTGFGAWPAPWEWRRVQRFFAYPFRRFRIDWKTREHSYVSFDAQFDEKGRFRNLTEEERSELGGVEYRALGALMVILIAYQFLWLLLGTIFLVPYAYRDSVVHALGTSQGSDVNPGWWGFFSVITGYANGGLNILNSNFIPFSGYYYILIVEILLTIAGNTQFPIFLRLMIWSTTKVVPRHSRLRQTLQFLLDHPRRCFLYLFPSRETWYLLTIQLTIDITMWILFIVLNIGMPVYEEMPRGTRIFDGLFQATGLRTSGSYIVNVGQLAPALLVAYVVAMYISSFPIVMALRQTNTYEERSIGLDRGESGGGLAQHLRRQLAYDIWFQILAWGLICTVERGKILSQQDGFNSFNILFETTSAYGTVGLSTGVSYDTISLCGTFQTLSKVILLFVMVRGRHRGLPLAIDRSILLPGEELMRRMDEHYHGLDEEALERVREAEDADRQSDQCTSDESSQRMGNVRPQSQQETGSSMYFNST